MANLVRAIEIAVAAHKNQVDKAGAPYILHPLRVMQMGTNENEMICGVLHDVVEDSEWTFEMLKNEGFSDDVIESLKCLTKSSENENYDKFIDRVCTNAIAVKVKINDLLDNMNITRLTTLENSDIKRLDKYLNSYQKLKNYENKI